VRTTGKAEHRFAGPKWLSGGDELSRKRVPRVDVSQEQDFCSLDIDLVFKPIRPKTTSHLNSEICRRKDTAMSSSVSTEWPPFMPTATRNIILQFFSTVDDTSPNTGDVLADEIFATDADANFGGKLFHGSEGRSKGMLF
jgi:hypothetical protein